MNRFVKMACIACLGITSQGVAAYNYLTDTCGTLNFSGGNMTFNYANNLSTAEKNEISTAFSRLTAFSDSTITTNDNGDSSFSTGNSQNEIYHNTNVGTADCWVSYNTSSCNVIEADIRFGDEPWVTGTSSSHWPYDTSATTGGRSIMGTAVHEGGHCLGMAHENTVYNMMGEEWSHVTRNGVATYYGPGEDLSDGLIDLHGKRSTTDIYRDVGASVLRYEFADGAYSDHQFGVLRNLSGTALPVVGSYEGQDIFQIVAGHAVRMELTFENNGELNSENANTGYYLSTNSVISTSDTQLQTGNVSLGRGAPYETAVTVTIPINTTPGNYFLGVYVDHDNLIPEVTTANNVGYYPVTILPPPPDLTVPFAGVDDATLLPGQAFSALAIVRNDGEGPSDATTLRYYRSTNSTISNGDTQIGTDAIGALAAGAIQSTNDPDTAPVTPGTWWIGACVDSVANEANTTNQCSSGVQITVAIQVPAATTNAVTDINTTQATLHATVNPNGGATTLYFDWGTDNQYGNTLTYGAVGSGLSNVSVNKLLSGLACNTTYQVRVRAVNSAGTTIGNVQEFTTLACPGCGG
jgi:hypothetical protein